MNTLLENTKADSLAAIEQHLGAIKAAADKLAHGERFTWAHAGSLAQIETQLAIIADFAQSGTR